MAQSTPPSLPSRAAGASAVGLEGCRIQHVLEGRVEIVEAAPADRRFPDRVGESLGIVLKGGAAHDVVADGRALRYPHDALCVRPPGCVWSTASTGPASFLSIDIDAACLPPGRVGGPMRFIAPERVPALRENVLALRFDASPLRQQTAATELVDTLLCLGLFAAPDLAPSASARAAERARELLTSRLADPPSLHALAEAVGANRFVLLRTFRRRFGVPPHAFVLRLRIERARAMLARGVDIAQIAQSLGFADQSHLTRVFTRAVGVPPAGYRRLIVAGAGNAPVNIVQDRRPVPA
jgi:AraC-like DNA-binding protein